MLRSQKRLSEILDLKRGAIASSVAHDSHNIIAVGVDDESIRDAVNLVIEIKRWGQRCGSSKSLFQ